MFDLPSLCFSLHFQDMRALHPTVQTGRNLIQVLEDLQAKE